MELPARFDGEDPKDAWYEKFVNEEGFFMLRDRRNDTICPVPECTFYFYLSI